MEKILIATVLKPQGLKGELKCKLENQNYDLISDIKEVYLNNKDVPTKIVNKSFRGGFLYLQFSMVNSREKADLLRNSKIFALREQINLPKNEYMITDLIGIDVVDQNNQTIGILKDVQNYGASDILIIEQYKREYMVPFVDDIVLNVNIKTNKIVVNRQKYDEAKICD